MRFLSQVVKEMKKELYTYDWLPKEQRAWYNKSISSLSKRNKVSILVLRFLTNSIAQSPPSDTKSLQMVKYFSAS